MSNLWVTAALNDRGEWEQEIHHHPTVESTQHILDHYGFDDAYPSGTSGAKAWAEVKGNYVEDHPVTKAMRADIARNGIKEPIRIDYHQSPPVVTDGHTRLWHAEALGLRSVPVRHAEHWDTLYPEDKPACEPPS